MKITEGVESRGIFCCDLCKSSVPNMQIISNSFMMHLREQCIKTYCFVKTVLFCARLLQQHYKNYQKRYLFVSQTTFSWGPDGLQSPKEQTQKHWSPLVGGIPVRIISRPGEIFCARTEWNSEEVTSVRPPDRSGLWSLNKYGLEAKTNKIELKFRHSRQNESYGKVNLFSIHQTQFSDILFT